MSLVCISLVKDGADAITGGGNVVLSKVGMWSWCLTVCHLLVYPMISLRSTVYSIKLLYLVSILFSEVGLDWRIALLDLAV